MKTWLVSLSLVGSLGCFTGTALAATSNTVPRGMSQNHTNLHPVTADVQNADGESIHQWGDIKSSVQVTRETLRNAYQASHDAYTNKLQKYAKCSAHDAKKAIASEHPGMTIEEFQLRNIRTSLVYMAIARDEEDKYLVIVDAGNGQILLDKRLPTHHERVFAPGSPDHGSEE